MRLTEDPRFQTWYEGRNQQAQHGHQCQASITPCAACGETDDWIESDTCLACLAVQFGEHRAYEQIGDALTRFTTLLAFGDKALVGEIVGEIASFASDLITECAAENAPPRPQAPGR